VVAFNIRALCFVRASAILQTPMQTNGIDCGYFVMRFMKEIILANQDMIPENVCM